MTTATILPTNARESQISKTLGDSGWSLLRVEASVPCFSNQKGALVFKVRPYPLGPPLES
jgi:hypothetical protein